MFEYINPGFYILSGILILMSLILIGFNAIENQRNHSVKEFPSFGVWILVLAIISPLLVSLNTKSNINENTDAFKQNKFMECHTLADSYLVSQENGWKLFEDSFTKDSLSIRADKCERVEG